MALPVVIVTKRRLSIDNVALLVTINVVCWVITIWKVTRVQMYLIEQKLPIHRMVYYTDKSYPCVGCP